MPAAAVVGAFLFWPADTFDGRVNSRTYLANADSGLYRETPWRLEAIFIAPRFEDARCAAERANGYGVRLQALQLLQYGYSVAFSVRKDD